VVIAVNNNHLNNVGIPQDQLYATQGVSFYNAGNYSAAWSCFNEAIRINPNESKYFYGRAGASALLGNTQAAITDFNKAISLAKNNNEKGWAHYDMAIVYASLGNVEKAKFHVISAARCGHGISQDFCRQQGIAF